MPQPIPTRLSSRLPPPSLWLILLAFLLVVASASASAQDLDLLSTDSSGNLSLHGGSSPFISGNGQFVVFHGTFLLPEDTTGGQVYLRDRHAGTLELISVNPSGFSINSSATLPETTNAGVVSDNGRYVAFKSAATDVVTAPASGGFIQLYLRDRLTNTTSMVSVNSAGEPANSHIGHFALAPVSGAVFPNRGESVTPASIAFNSNADNLDPLDTFSDHNTFFHTTEPFSTRVGCLDMNGALIEGGCRQFAWNGAEIVFTSYSRSVTASDGDFQTDIFYALPFVSSGNIHITKDFKGVSSDWAEASAPSISNEGGLIAFASNFSLLFGDPPGTPDVWIFRLDSMLPVRIGHDLGASPAGSVRLSTSGGWLAIETSQSLDPIDTGSNTDVYVTEIDVNITSGFASADWTLISQNQGMSATMGATIPTVSNFGAVTFQSRADNLAPILDNNFVSDIFASHPLGIFTDGFETGDISRW